MNDRDEMIERLAAQLRVLPEVNQEAKARVLIAVAAERERDRESRTSRRQWTQRMPWIGSGALIAAALLAIVYTQIRPTVQPSSVAQVTAPVGNVPDAQLVAADAAQLEMAARPVQFVYRAPDVSSVRVVGDFNGWDKEQVQMVRDSASGLWSATVMIRPGRHVYAFVVNDSVWTRDPRAVAAPDADFGRPGSVLIVERSGVPGNR